MQPTQKAARLISGDKRDRELRSRSRLSPRLRYAPIHRPGSAHAPPIQCIGADCASQFEIGAFAPSQTCDARGSTAALERYEEQITYSH
jgi:hypothetical protein